LTGGIYYIEASSTTQSSITISSCTYSNNFGGTGGIFAIYNYFDFTLASSVFNDNIAIYGGIFYLSSLTSQTYYSKATI
jgi:hypothetical protein